MSLFIYSSTNTTAHPSSTTSCLSHVSQMLAAASSSQHLPQQQPSAQYSQSEPVTRRPRANRRVNPEVQLNAQGGEVLNEEELNWDWLDWVYTVSRAAVLLTIVYFYSSFSRFLMVMMVMLVLYLWVWTCLPFLFFLWRGHFWIVVFLSSDTRPVGFPSIWRTSSCSLEPIRMRWRQSSKTRTYKKWYLLLSFL